MWQTFEGHAMFRCPLHDGFLFLMSVNMLDIILMLTSHGLVERMMGGLLVCVDYAKEKIFSS